MSGWYYVCTTTSMRLDTNDTRSDLQLLKLSRSGDCDAFGQLARKHYRSCV